MKRDPASLENLRDIALPTPIPWWPPAVGWWLVLAFIAIAIAVMLVWAWRTWRANAYRRAALLELKTATTITGIAEILKRTALAAYPRSEVASLSGSAWCQWLEESGGCQLQDDVVEALTHSVFDNDDSANVDSVKSFAVDWINHCPNRTGVRHGGSTP